MTSFVLDKRKRGAKKAKEPKVEILLRISNFCSIFLQMQAKRVKKQPSGTVPTVEQISGDVLTQVTKSGKPRACSRVCVCVYVCMYVCMYVYHMPYCILCSTACFEILGTSQHRRTTTVQPTGSSIQRPQMCPFGYYCTCGR